MSMKFAISLTLSSAACSTLISCATAQEREANVSTAPYTAMSYAPGRPDIMGFTQFVESKDAAVAEALRQCKEYGGENCYPGLVYNQCGSVAELQIGNPTGNPKGWAAAETLREALDTSLQRCNSYARRIATNRYDRDETYAPRVKTAICAVVYYHCTTWGEIDVDQSFGAPDDPFQEPPDVSRQ